jgi:hypothetical protein
VFDDQEVKYQRLKQTEQLPLISTLHRIYVLDVTAAQVDRTELVSYFQQTCHRFPIHSDRCLLHRGDESHCFAMAAMQLLAEFSS